MQTENAEMRLFSPMPMCARFDYTGLGSIIQLVARTSKSARQAGGHLKKCFCDHHFDKAIFPTTHSPLRSGKMAPSLSTFSHLHTYRPIIIVIIFITLPGTLLPSSLFPRQISLVGRENWVSNLLWQAELCKGQWRAQGDWSVWTVPGLMCVIWWGTRRGK